jgi:hypothetical protein
MRGSKKPGRKIHLRKVGTWKKLRTGERREKKINVKKNEEYS